jgi:NTE family protein
MLPRPLAYVLGGGGSRGAVQLGMLRALATTDLRPDLVVGTSVGSLNGAILASEPGGAAAKLEDIWPRIDRQQVFPGGFFLKTLAATTSGRPYVFDPTPLSELMAECIPESRFEDLELPFVAMATDLDTGVRVELDSGDLRSALLASSAVPIAFPWVERDGRRLVDGGLVDNIPVREARARGARSVMVLDCGIFGAEGRWSEGIMGVAVQALAIAGRQQITVDLEIAAEVPVLYFPVPATIPTTIFDFESAEALAQESYEQGMRARCTCSPASDPSPGSCRPASTASLRSRSSTPRSRRCFGPFPSRSRTPVSRRRRRPARTVPRSPRPCARPRTSSPQYAGTPLGRGGRGAPRRPPRGPSPAPGIR